MTASVLPAIAAAMRRDGSMNGWSCSPTMIRTGSEAGSRRKLASRSGVTRNLGAIAAYSAGDVASSLRSPNSA